MSTVSQCVNDASLVLQHRGVEHREQGGHLWEPSLGPQRGPVPHHQVQQRHRRPVHLSWEVSDSFKVGFGLFLVELSSVDKMERLKLQRKGQSS